MVLTKQDIERITKELAKTGVRDSSFRKIEQPTAISDVPIIVPTRGAYENRRISINDFLDYISQKLDLSKITCTYGDSTTTLANFITWVATCIRNNGGVLTDSITADMVSYTDPHLANCDTINDALSYILNILYGDTAFPTAASDNEIDALFLVFSNND